MGSRSGDGQPIGPRSESTQVVIAEPQAPATQLSPQHAIFVDQIRHARSRRSNQAVIASKRR